MSGEKGASDSTVDLGNLIEDFGTIIKLHRDDRRNNDPKMVALKKVCESVIGETPIFVSRIHPFAPLLTLADPQIVSIVWYWLYANVWGIPIESPPTLPLEVAELSSFLQKKMVPIYVAPEIVGWSGAKLLGGKFLEPGEAVFYKGISSIQCNDESGWFLVHLSDRPSKYKPLVPGWVTVTFSMYVIFSLVHIVLYGVGMDDGKCKAPGEDHIRVQTYDETYRGTTTRTFWPWIAKCDANGRLYATNTPTRDEWSKLPTRWALKLPLSG